MARDEDGISFSKNEIEALKQIVSDWLGEEIVVPPFLPEIEAILRKLNLTERTNPGASYKPPKQASSRPARRSGI